MKAELDLYAQCVEEKKLVVIPPGETGVLYLNGANSEFEVVSGKGLASLKNESGEYWHRVKIIKEMELCFDIGNECLIYNFGEEVLKLQNISKMEKME